MIIGVISDSHPETGVAASAIEWLLARGADLLVHAGDIVESETLRLLRQSGKPYFAILGNNDEALTEFKNEFDLYDEPFCTEFAGLRLKIMHHPFYLFDEEPAAQNEADGLNLNANLSAGADRAVNLDANFNAAGVDKILNGVRSTDKNFKNAHSASANLKSGQSASLNASLGVNTDVDVNSNANLDLSLDADLASSPNANLNSNANLAADMGSDIKSKASLVLAASIASFVSLKNSVPPRNFALLQNSIPSQNFTSSRNSALPQNSMPESYPSYAKKESQTPSFGYVKIYDRTSFFAAVADHYVTSMDYRRYGNGESKGLTDKRGISKNGTSANGRSVTTDCHSTSAHQNSAMRNQNTAAMDWCDVSIDKSATAAYRQNYAAVSYYHMAVNQNTLAAPNLNLRHTRVKSGRDLRAQKAAFRFACIVVQEQKLRASSLHSQRKEL